MSTLSSSQRYSNDTSVGSMKHEDSGCTRFRLASRWRIGECYSVPIVTLLTMHKKRFILWGNYVWLSKLNSRPNIFIRPDCQNTDALLLKIHPVVFRGLFSAVLRFSRVSFRFMAQSNSFQKYVLLSELAPKIHEFLRIFG